MKQTMKKHRTTALTGAAVALALGQTACSAALWGNFLIVLLALAIFVGTIRLGGGEDDRKPPAD